MVSNNIRGTDTQLQPVKVVGVKFEIILSPIEQAAMLTEEDITKQPGGGPISSWPIPHRGVDNERGRFTVRVAL
jgi:hypothetical protein